MTEVISHLRGGATSAEGTASVQMLLVMRRLIARTWYSALWTTSLATDHQAVIIYTQKP